MVSIWTSKNSYKNVMFTQLNSKFYYVFQQQIFFKVFVTIEIIGR